MLWSEGWELLVPLSAPEPSLPAGLAGAGQENISPAASVLLEVSVLGGTSSLPGSPLPRGEPRAPSPGGISEGFLSSSAGGGASTPTSSTRIVSWLDMTMTCRGVPKRPSAPGAGPRLLGSPRPMGLGLGEPPVPHLLHGNMGSPEQFCSCGCNFAPAAAVLLLWMQKQPRAAPRAAGSRGVEQFSCSCCPPHLALCAPTCSLTVSGASWVCTASGSMVSPGRRERAGGGGSHLPHAASEGHRSLSPSHRAPRGHALGAERARRRTFQEAAEESVSPPRRGWGCGASPVCLVRVKTHSGGQASSPLLSHRAWGDEG